MLRVVMMQSSFSHRDSRSSYGQVSKPTKYSTEIHYDDTCVLKDAKKIISLRILKKYSTLLKIEKKIF